MQVTAQELDLTRKVHHCIQQQQWHQAKHYCQRLLKANPVDAQVHHLLGLIHVQIAAASSSADLRREHQERAVSAFEAATRNDPGMLDAHINLGHAYLQVHHIDDALSSYQSALSLAPDSDFIHASMAEAHRRHKHMDQALACYGQAIQLAPQKTGHLINMGNLLRELQRQGDAIACYEQAIQIEPNHAEAYAQMAISMVELGHTDAALGCCKIAIEIDPQLSMAHHHRALLEMRLGDEAAALVSLEAALALQPRLSTAWMSKGLALIKRQDYASAKSDLNRAIELGLSGSDVFQSRALCHKELGQLDKAIDDLETALEIDPTHGGSLMTLGTISHELKRYEAALHLYTQAIQHNPKGVEAYSNLGAVLFDLNRHEDARITLEAAIELDPLQVNVWSNLGANLKALHRFEDALKAYDRVLELDPKHVEAMCHKGLVLQDMKHLEASLACYEQALTLESDNTLAKWNKAIGLLLQGDFAQGWAAYEARWSHKKLNLTLRSYSQPRWTGSESLQGKRVLVYCEQGLGDTLQFARFVPALVHQGAQVFFEVQPQLVSLLSRCLPDVQVFGMGQLTPDFDLHSPLVSLPYALHCTATEHFRPTPYLNASSNKIVEWRERLGDDHHPRIGLVWSGNAAHQNDRNRSIPLQSLLSALPKGYDYICLQNQIRDEDHATLSKASSIRSFTEEIKDFEDTAALCHLMDLVITVDTSVAHLSAAIGKTTWTLIPFSPDWRWMLDRTDTPWYPTMRLHRQLVPGTWNQSLTALTADLLRLLPTDTQASNAQDPVSLTA